MDGAWRSRLEADLCSSTVRAGRVQDGSSRALQLVPQAAHNAAYRAASRQAHMLLNS